MKQGLLITLLAMLSIPLIGAGGNGQASASVPTDLINVNVENPTADEDRTQINSNLSNEEIAAEALKLNQADFASKEQAAGNE